jgi:hypothetical protein
MMAISSDDLAVQYGLGDIPAWDPAYEEWRLGIEAKTMTAEVRHDLARLKQWAVQEDASCAAGRFIDRICQPKRLTPEDEAPHGEVRAIIRGILHGRRPGSSS